MGRRRWSPTTLRRLRLGLAEGLGNAELAVRFRTTEAAVSCARRYHGLDAPPLDYMTLAEASRELGVTPEATQGLLKARGITLSPWGGKYMTVKAADIRRLKDERSILDEKPDGYVTARELADRWGVDTSHVLRLLADVPRLMCRTRQSCRRPVACWPEPSSPIDHHWQPMRTA